MTTIGYGIVILAVCAAAAVILWDRRRLRRTMGQLDEMLDAAIRDEFRETAFDESIHSSVETKLMDYLSASALSARKVQKERENIETLISAHFRPFPTPQAPIHHPSYPTNIRQIIIPRRSRGYFLCGQSPLFSAYASNA